MIEWVSQCYYILNVCFLDTTYFRNWHTYVNPTNHLECKFVFLLLIKANIGLKGKWVHIILTLLKYKSLGLYPIVF